MPSKHDKLDIEKLSSAGHILASEVAKFPFVTFLDDVQLSDGLLSGSITNAVVVACSDMGAWVPFVCSAPTVQLFLFQNFGHNFDSGGLVETVVEKGVRNVAVYGHSDCEYLKFLAKSAQGLSAVEEQRQLYAHALESDTEAAWTTVGQYNVLAALKQMLVDPTLAPLVASGELNIHGWFYNSAVRQLELFDPIQKAFMAVVK